MRAGVTLEDQARFRALYAAHATELLRFYARRTLDPQAAVDLVGETFAQAFAGRRGFRGGEDPEVARRLEISEESARARVSRGLRALHARLNPEVSA